MDPLVIGLAAALAVSLGLSGWALAERARWRDHAKRLPALEERLADQSDAAADLATRNAELETKLKLLDGTLEDRVAGLSRAAMEQNKTALADLLKPVSEKLTAFDRKVGEVEVARREAYGALSSQLKGLAETQSTLSNQTQQLSTALSRSSGDAGRWGEVQLLRVVELAGMREHCDYNEQVTIATDGGVQRPDMVVHLPGGQHIVVDAKAPTSAYLAAAETDDPAERGRLLDAYITNLRTILTQLSRKSYWKAVEGPEFVILFLPAESFYADALARDPKLIEDGFKDGVVLATPTTLLTLLKAAAYGWRQEALAENAKEVGRLGAEVHHRLAVLSTHAAKLGRALSSAVQAYNATVGSLDGPVAASARKLKDAGVETHGKELPQLTPVETAIRVPTPPDIDFPRPAP